MRLHSVSNPVEKFFLRPGYPSVFRIFIGVFFFALIGWAHGQRPPTTILTLDRSKISKVPTTSSAPAPSISHEVKDIFEKSAKAIVKIRGTDEHGDFAGTGFF